MRKWGTRKFPRQQPTREDRQVPSGFQSPTRTERKPGSSQAWARSRRPPCSTSLEDPRTSLLPTKSSRTKPKAVQAVSNVTRVSGGVRSARPAATCGNASGVKNGVLSTVRHLGQCVICFSRVRLAFAGNCCVLV
ncbi:hypothetical protein RISK_002380 [Rhodopirellula islandica]|uniref:Uncharacterized protein n=1 Tax=Rhodopirellula islandica TaxID=595434 RepID=A0A0J1BGS7_RHOIS|nr:hypothetical protein RISK_002380 [Rhodopirellula islandica]